MNKKPLLFLFFLVMSLTSFAQKTSLEKITNPYFKLVRSEFKGDLAYETVAFVEQFWRISGNTGFDATVYRIAEKLEDAGYINEDKAKDSDRFTYRIEKREMQHPTWEPVNASLQLVGDPENLLSSETNRNMVYQYSSSTPDSGVKAEVLYIPNEEAMSSFNLSGKILFSDVVDFSTLKSAMVQENAVGVLTYDMPAYLQPEKNVTSIQFRGMRHNPAQPVWAIALSYEAKEKLKARLAEGKVEVLVNVKTKIYESTELTVVANVRGAELPNESLVFSAHIQEPGANDNATGVGTQLEMAAITSALIRQGKLDLKRTLTFLWGDEIVSTRRYITEKDKRNAAINWGISLDMVGENTELTGGTFLIEKMPDPSAIWTRGEDKHSEWGGSPMNVQDMKPHYLNDLIIANFEAQGKFANWEVKTNPFEGGSDHTPFLQADIPGLLLWHFTDQFYHTDNDRLDKVSQETMQNVGAAALVSAYTLLNADTETGKQIAQHLLESAISRLQAESKLSKQAIEKGEDASEQKLILETWKNWYLKALDSTSDLSSKPDENLGATISIAKQQLEAAYQAIMMTL